MHKFCINQPVAEQIVGFPFAIALSQDLVLASLPNTKTISCILEAK